MHHQFGFISSMSLPSVAELKALLVAHEVAILLSMLAVGGLVVGLLTRSTYLYWKGEGVKIASQSGYLTKGAPFLARLTVWAVSVLLSSFFLGRLRIKGGAKLRDRRTRYILAPNHQVRQDALVMARIIGWSQPSRFMISINEVQGWRGTIMAWVGAISVLTTSSRKAVAALISAAKALVKEAGSWFVIFPQGKLVENDELSLDDFHTGPFIIGSKVESESGTPVSIVPVNIRYLTKAEAGWGTLFLAGLGFKRNFFGATVYGAEVEIGDPLPVSAVPNGDKEFARRQLFDAMVAMRQGKQPSYTVVIQGNLPEPNAAAKTAS